MFNTNTGVRLEMAVSPGSIKLVSAIMPTRGRCRMARQALECFVQQTYSKKQLVILDDADDLSFPHGIPEQFLTVPIFYLRTPGLNIAQKRNICCEYAAGEVIAHFDSDDWSGPERIADQVARLEQSQKQVTGYHTMLFHDGEKHQAYRYFGLRTYAIGTSLTYFRDWWKTRRFPEDRVFGEDNAFVKVAQIQKQLETADARDLMVARIHSDNTSSKDTNGTNYKQTDMVQIPRGFFEWEP